MRIGIDFDNTIVTYDEVFRSAAIERGLIAQSFQQGGKQAIRDEIRLLPDGEIAWQKLQGFVYGAGISGARLCEGVARFLRRCRSEGATVFIVSHKTEFGHYDPARVNLRQAAREWMNRQGFFRADGFGIAPENVFFEGTRAEKLARIASLGCTHFVDDLEEVVGDPAFPPRVKRILYADTRAASPGGPFCVCPTWPDVEKKVFNGHG